MHDHLGIAQAKGELKQITYAFKLELESRVRRESPRRRSGGN